MYFWLTIELRVARVEHAHRLLSFTIKLPFFNKAIEESV